MNCDKLYEFTKQQRFTDVHLVLHDGIDELNMDLHKNILCASCEYFEMMFRNCREKNESVVNMTITNVFVVHDIITSFYNQKTKSGGLPEWKYYLELIRCYDFLGLQYDINEFCNLKVPPEGFELLLDVINQIGESNVINQIGESNATIRMIYDNLPQDYDLSQLSQEILKKMLYVIPDYEIIAISNTSDKRNKIIKLDPIKNTISCTFDDLDTVDLMNCSFDNKHLVLNKKNDFLYVWNMETNKLVRTFDMSKWKPCLFRLSPDIKQIAIACSDQAITILDADTNRIIYTFRDHTYRICSMCYSP